MDFLLSHWHCIVPVIVIAAVLLLQGQGKKTRGNNRGNNTGKDF